MHSPHLERNITLRRERKRESGNKPVCAPFPLASRRMHLLFSKKKKMKKRKGWRRSKGKQPQGDFQGGQDINKQTLLSSSHTHAPPNQRGSAFCLPRARTTSADIPLRQPKNELLKFCKGEIWLVENDYNEE